MAGETREDLIDALDTHTDTESAGDGGDNKVGCWLTGDAIANRKNDVINNLTLLAEAYGYEYDSRSVGSSGVMVVFANSDE